MWSPLPESGQQGTHVKTQFIVHSTGDNGTAEAVYRYFARPDVVVESTFIVGLGPADPTRQILDSAEVADANLTANERAISVEVVGSEHDDYTDWQKSEIIRLARWALTQHPIEPRVCPAPDQSGFGWHVMFGSPGPWTPVAKSCPGDLRIQRLQAEVFPAIFAPDNPTPSPVREDDMMLIRNSKGTVVLVADRWAEYVDAASYKSLSANMLTSQLSDAMFDRVVASARQVK